MTIEELLPAWRNALGAIDEATLQYLIAKDVLVCRERSLTTARRTEIDIADEIKRLVKLELPQ